MNRLITASFWHGVALIMCLFGMLQDCLGLELYLKHVSSNWWSIPWYLWILPISVIIILQFWIRLPKQQNNSKQQED